MADNITILCVDDEQIPRELRKLILVKQGYRGDRCIIQG